MFHRQIEITVRAHDVRLPANEHFVVTEIRADIEVIPLSINRTDRICSWQEARFRLLTFLISRC